MQAGDWQVLAGQSVLRKDLQMSIDVAEETFAKSEMVGVVYAKCF